MSIVRFFFGIALNGPGGGSTIGGNYIGVNATGTTAQANTGAGIVLIGSNGNFIGGVTPADRNVISGNAVGLQLSPGAGNVISGNYIGTNAAGTAAVPNTNTGMDIFGAANTIGGTAFVTLGGPCTGACNLVSGNGSIGILLEQNADNTVVQGNQIGTNVAGIAGIPNGAEGLDVAANNVTVGGGVAAERNIIAFNNGSGIHVENGTGSAILGNSIHSNGLLGIDINNDGVTPNDVGDADTGPNNLQNFPVITGLVISAGAASFTTTLNSTANEDFRIEFFASAACDASGNGEGQTFIGFRNVTTDGSGNVSISTVGLPLPAGQSVITATATNSTTNDTSEFSACACAAPPLPTLSINNVSQNEGNSGTTAFTFTVTLSAASASTVTVNFATADGSATAPSDYASTSGVLTFAPGVTSRTITVNVVGDTNVEPNETFMVNLSSPTNATIATGTGTGTIVNDDAAALPTLSINNVSQNEGNSGTTAFTFTVTLSAASASTVTVNFATANGTATAGSDYTATSGVLTFNPGITTQSITVNVTGDTAPEGNETFFVNLSGASNATIAVVSGTGTILNDDFAAPQPNVVIPTLSEWGLLLLALLLGSVAVLRLRRGP